MTDNKNLYWHFVRENKVNPLDWLDNPFIERWILDSVGAYVGTTVCRVYSLDGRSGRVLWTMECSHILESFARKCALDVAHLWPCPPIVRKYLETGNNRIRISSKAKILSYNRRAEMYRRHDTISDNSPLSVDNLAFDTVYCLYYSEYKAAIENSAMALCDENRDKGSTECCICNETYNRYNKELEKLVLAEHERLCQKENQ